MREQSAGIGLGWFTLGTIVVGIVVAAGATKHNAYWEADVKQNAMPIDVAKYKSQWHEEAEERPPLPPLKPQPGLPGYSMSKSITSALQKAFAP